MGFLRRLLGSSEPANAGYPAGLAQLDGPVVVGPNGRLYASTTCPWCGVPLDPLPTRRGKCPACHEEIVYAKTPDEIRFLHRPGEDLGLEAEEAEDMAARNEYSAQMPVRPRRLRDVRRRQLQRAAGLGLVVRIQVADEEPRTCAPCKALDGQVYRPEAAPLLPLEACRSRYVCDCDYVLELPS
jgi:hypothetical protein